MFGLLLACSASSVKLEVLGEDGSVLTDAVALRPGASVEANSSGRIPLRLERPELWLVEAPGHLAEPVIVGPEDHLSRVEVRLLRDSGRHVLHFGGDVMFGRRYEDSGDGEPVIDPSDRDAGARAVVSDLAHFFGSADVSMVNLETVVADLDEAGAYPAKRWLLQTHPDNLAALDELGVDVVGLANNHQRDWLDAGVDDTLDALDSHGLPWLGAGGDADEALRTLVVDVDGYRVGVAAFTSVDGSFVNNWLPTAEDVMPDDVEESALWKWEERSWGVEDIPVEARLPGDAWRLFSEAEDAIDPDDPEAGLQDPDAAWASLWAVYPELQDWIAGRGHGGAAGWDRSTAEAVVAELAADSDLVVVQLHMGFQFATAPSSNVRSAAQSVLDAGADVVIGHHPHVLQGIEVHDGKLIAWSLGNLAFDQDFLATWRSAVLRTVYDDEGALVQARLVPVLVDEYRPVPVAGSAAQDILREVFEHSQRRTTGRRGEDGRVRALLEGAETDATGLAWEHGTARIVPTGLTDSESLRVPRKGSAELPQDGLVGVSGEGVLVGRDLWSFGSFEDVDGDAWDDVAGWSLSPSASIVHSGDPQRHVLELTREGLNQSSVTASFVARVTLPEHRLWSGEDGEGIDGDATWSLRFLARGEGDRNEGIAHVTLVYFDDIDPTLDPWTVTLHELELPITLRGMGWGEVLLDLPPEAFEPVDGLVANAAIVKFELPPPPVRTTRLQIDDVEFVEWRPARGDLGAYTRVRSADDSGRTASVEVMPW